MANNNLDLMLEKAIKDKAEKIIREEVRKLERITKDVVQGYYNSYSPTVYDRTYGFKNSIISGNVEKAGKRISAEVSFDGRAMHNSLFAGNAQGYVPVLINNGWVSRKLEAKIGIIPRFTRYEGYDLIGKIESRYNAIRHPLANPLKIKGL